VVLAQDRMLSSRSLDKPRHAASAQFSAREARRRVVPWKKFQNHQAAGQISATQCLSITKRQPFFYCLTRIGQDGSVMTGQPTHGLPTDVIAMIHGEISTALACLQRVSEAKDSRHVFAAIVLLEEALPELAGKGGKPRRAIPWLDCANQLLRRGGTAEINSAREHTSAALDLLTFD
jgi:hypothetical protein